MSEIFDSISTNPLIDRLVDLSYDFSGQIIRLLKKRNMTQHELAVKLGKKDSEISRWLQGNHNFTLRTIAALEVAFDIEIVNIREVVPYEETTSLQNNTTMIDRKKGKIMDQVSWAPLGPALTNLNSKQRLPIDNSLSLKPTEVLL